MMDQALETARAQRIAERTQGSTAMEMSSAILGFFCVLCADLFASFA